jgi:uncharacterized CHY-type Zn-finger protein
MAVQLQRACHGTLPWLISFSLNGCPRCQCREQTQCAHYQSERDVVAVRFKCCNAFYACIHCHEELAGHMPVVWGKGERETHAIFCGNCHKTLSIAEYLDCRNCCPLCGAAFNPQCAQHYDLYFEL